MEVRPLWYDGGWIKELSGGGHHCKLIGLSLPKTFTCMLGIKITDLVKKYNVRISQGDKLRLSAWCWTRGT